MAPQQYAGASFLVMSMVFLAIGISGNRVFIAIGLAFIVMAIMCLRRT